MNREDLIDSIREAIDGAIPDDIPGYRQRYADKATDRVLAVIDSREAAVRERAASELIDLRRTASEIKGAAGSVKRRHVDQALLEGAVRITNETHAEDVYPDGWLNGIRVWGGEQP